MNLGANRSTEESLELQWSPEFNLGHPLIDTQHQNLFRIFNSLVKMFYGEKPTGTVRQVIGELMDYTQQHFSDEEKLMSSYGFSELNEHSEMHRKLISELEMFVTDIEEDVPVLTYEVLHFVKTWVFDHILEEDMKLKPQIQAAARKPAADSPAHFLVKR